MQDDQKNQGAKTNKRRAARFIPIQNGINRGGA